MNAASWHHIIAVFEQATQLPAEEQQGFLDRACGEDAEVRHAIARLLRADSRNDTWLDRSLAKHPAVAAAIHDGSTAQPAASPDTIGAYRLLQKVGEGGMSTVYLAVRDDDAFSRRVVVKLVRRGMESEEILRRLRTERQILASLDHPYIARLFDGGSTGNGLPYFVMEHIDGVPIDAYCENRRMSVAERLSLFRKVCAAVHYAHQNLIVHRDIKPSNILVTADGDPKLLDFGIAKLLDPDLAWEDSEPTATWQRLMTPSYASPEQLGGTQITTASDVYSLGVLLYKLLTGRLPRSFRGLSQREIERLLSETEPVRPSGAVSMPPETEPGSAEDRPTSATGRDPEREKMLRKQLTGDLDAIVLKALRGAPEQRYGSVERFAADLDCHQRRLPVTARTGTWRYRTSKYLRRNRTAVAVAAGVALLLVGFAAAMARQRDQARLERDKKQAVLKLVLEVFRFSNPYVLPGDELTVREALERSVPVLQSGLGEQPQVRAELLYTSGSILTVLGDLQTARHQLEESLAIRRQLHGDNHGDVVAAMSALAAVQKELGELDEAVILARRSVELARSLVGEDDSSLAGPLNELVSVLCYQSEYEAAEGYALEALELARGSTPDQEILAWEYLAVIRGSQGRYREAAELYRQSLARRRQRYGDKHPEQINTLSNLGVALRRQGDFEAAEAAYLEVVELQRETLPKDFKDPFTLGNLAGLRFGLGNYSSAEKLYREAREAVLETSGSEHWMVFVFELGIEQARIRQGAAGEAEGRLRHLLEHWRPSFGEDHPRIAQGTSTLGESISLQGRCKEAEPLLVGSYELLLEGAKHRQQQDAFERLRQHLERCGRPQEIARYEAMAQGR